MTKKYTGKDPIRLYKSIIEDIKLQKDHCAYLGHELARAKYCLDNNIKYIQDAGQ